MEQKGGDQQTATEGGREVTESDRPLLKPCPFCGGEGEAKHVGPADYAVFCTVIGCCIGPFRENERKAVKAWNTRKEDKK